MRVEILLVVPVVIHLAAALACLLVRRHLVLQRAVSVAGCLATAATAAWLLGVVWREGIISTTLGWRPPYGITFVADMLSALMLQVSTLMGCAVAVYAIGSIEPERERYGYHPIFQVLLMGINGSFLTGDIFNMFVWFEVMLIASFVLMALGGERRQLEGSVKYMAISMISTALFLVAIAVLYGTAGTLNLADLSVWMSGQDKPGLSTVAAMLLLGAFGIKAGVFPLFFWLPASYPTPPIPVTAIFAAMLTKVGVYALIRVFTLLFIHDLEFTHGLILVIAGLTMVTGVLAAASQDEVKRILSFHIISQIGYMVMGLGLFSRLALAGAVFYIAHHIVVKINLFLISGLMWRLKGSYELKHLGNLYRHHAWLAVLFLIPAGSLAGIPPLSGFWAKFFLVSAALRQEQYLMAGVALLVGFLTLYSMIKIWAEAFWKEAPGGGGPAPVDCAWDRSAPWLVVPVVLLAAATLIIGLMPELLFSVSDRAATQLLDPSQYIRAVMGGDD